MVDRDVWPELTLAAWEDTRTTLHLWTQVVGKIRLVLAPMVNEWWQVPLYVSARGLTTSLMPAGPVGLELEFDFVAHVLEARVTDGRRGQIALEPKTVASFYGETMALVRDLDIDAEVYPVPVEVEEAIPFAEDDVHRTYDPDAARRFWAAMVQSARVLGQFRARYVGKASPVHFFWGSFDLATTRFSGRTAPRHPGGAPHCPPEVMVLAYDQEVSSCGFWPGGSEEGSFYAYAYPTPDGFGAHDPGAPDARWDDDLGEFVLPYRTVRTADDPDSVLLSFLQATYEAAADLAHWDRAALEARWDPADPLGRR